MSQTQPHYRPIVLKDVPYLIELLAVNHQVEAKHHDSLPVFADFQADLNTELKSMIKHHGGWIVESLGRVRGFMIGLQIDELFGKSLGLVIPWHGWAVQGVSRTKMMSGLLTRVLNDGIQKGHTSMAWTISAHDRLAQNVACDLGFGSRCADAIRKTVVDSTHELSFRIERLTAPQLELIAPLHQAHNRYYRQAPLWMPNPEEDPLEDLVAWMSRDDRWIWAAFVDHQPVGYLRTQAHAESYLSHHPQMRNMTAAFVDPAWRQNGVATALVNQALQDLNDAGIRWCGVDFETINPSGSRFWLSQFKPYTMSLTRRIDERILDVME